MLPMRYLQVMLLSYYKQYSSAYRGTTHVYAQATIVLTATVAYCYVYTSFTFNANCPSC